MTRLYTKVTRLYKWRVKVGTERWEKKDLIGVQCGDTISTRRNVFPPNRHGGIRQRSVS